MDLTQAELAQKVGCALVTIKKIEQGDRKPSREMAVLLAKSLVIPEAVLKDFMEMARGKYVPNPPPSKDGLRIPAFLQSDAHPSRIIEGQFVERQPELARLAVYLDKVSSGKGMPVLILGDAGSGKTTLMAEFARRAQDLHPTLVVAGGQCNAQTGVGDPYRPFRDILGMLTGDLESNWLAGELKQEQLLRLWTSIPDTIQTITTYGPNLVNILLPLVPFLHRVSPYLAGSEDWLDRLQSLARFEQPKISGIEQSQVLEEVTQVLRDVAIRHPLLLLLDDLQWVDGASINLLFHLSRRLAGSRILLLGAFRPGENVSRQSSGHPDFSESQSVESLVLELARQYGDIQINLNLESPSESKAFVDAIIDREPNQLGDAFRDNLFHHTKGHPLFTVEMLRSMQESGKLVQDNAGRWSESTQSIPYSLPARVEAVIEQRLGRLMPGLVEMLSVASVEGQVFTSEIVASILGLDPQTFLKRLSHDLEQQYRLVQEQGEVQVGTLSLNRFQFRHLLFQEYLYGQLGQGEKRRLHREVAQGLEKILVKSTGKQFWAGEVQELAGLDHLDYFGPELVHHSLFGEVWDRAAAYALQMGNQARQRYAMREAIVYFEKALYALSQQANPQDDLAFAALIGWEEAAFKFKSYEEQLIQLLRAEEIARMHQDKPRLIQALHWKANVYLARGFWTRAGPALTECLALTEELDNEQLSVHPIYFKGLMTSFVDPRSALMWVDRALDLAKKYEDLQIEAIALATKGQVHAQLGEFAQSQNAIEGALQVAGRFGSPLTESDVDLLAAWACLAMGQAERGLALGKLSVEMAIATDNMDCICNGLACVGYGNLELGHIPEAILAFENGINRSEVSGAMIAKLNGQAGLAMAQFFTGYAGAIKDLESVLRNMHLFENEVGAANANHMLGRCFLQLGEFDRAETYLNDAIVYYRHCGMLPFLARTLMSMSELLEKRGRLSDALNSRQEADILLKSFVLDKEHV